MTCKNCIHVAVCREYVTDLAAAHNLKITKIEEFEAIMDCDGCDNFADRSRFVELPQSVHLCDAVHFVLKGLDEIDLQRYEDYVHDNPELLEVTK